MIHSWLGEKAGFEAAEQGFPVVMVPSRYLYLDMAHSPEVKEPGLYWTKGCVNPKIIYSYDPFAGEATANVRKNIIGLQTCLWGENLGFPRRTNIDKLPKNYVACPLEYMTFPRMIAFSETVWSLMKSRNWNHFSRNCPFEKKILDKFGIRYNPRFF